MNGITGESVHNARGKNAQQASRRSPSSQDDVELNGDKPHREGECSSCAIWAGACAGGVGVVVGQPFDTIKVRMQVGQDSQAQLGKQSGGPPIPLLAKIRSMYRGVVPPMVTSGFVSSLNFGGFEYVRRKLHDDASGIAPLYIHYIAGAGGALPVTLITCPVVLVKVQQQAAAHKVTIIQTVQFIWKQSGVRGLYRGYGVHALLEGYGRGWYMTAYEASKRALSKGGAGLDLPPERRMLAGASAGVVGWLSIYPLDVVRSRINAQGAGGGEGGAKYTGVVDCIVKTWREGGIRAFYKGLGFSMVRAAPVASVVLPTFDFVNRKMTELHRKGLLSTMIN